MAILLSNGRQYYSLASGLPNAGGKLFTYVAGTSTPKQTFTDASGAVPNTNPVVLDARGEASVFWEGVYKVALTDAAEVTIWTADNIDGRTPVVSTALAAYAQLAGAAFTGAVTSTASIGTTAAITATSGFLVDANFGLAINSLVPTITFDAGDTLSYNRTTNTITFSIGGTAIATISATGLNVVSGVPSSGGIELGYRDLPLRAVAAGPASIVLSDRGSCALFTGAASALTVPTNAALPFPYAAVASLVTIINNGSGVLTITRASGVTMQLAGTGSNADRNLAIGGIATLIKTGIDTWFISGSGVS